MSDLSESSFNRTVADLSCALNGLRAQLIDLSEKISHTTYDKQRPFQGHLPELRQLLERPEAGDYIDLRAGLQDYLKRNGCSASCPEARQVVVHREVIEWADFLLNRYQDSEFVDGMREGMKLFVDEDGTFIGEEMAVQICLRYRVDGRSTSNSDMPGTNADTLAMAFGFELRHEQNDAACSSMNPITIEDDTTKLRYSSSSERGASEAEEAHSIREEESLHDGAQDELSPANQKTEFLRAREWLGGTPERDIRLPDLLEVSHELRRLVQGAQNKVDQLYCPQLPSYSLQSDTVRATLEHIHQYLDFRAAIIAFLGRENIDDHRDNDPQVLDWLNLLLNLAGGRWVAHHISEVLTAFQRPDGSFVGHEAAWQYCVKETTETDNYERRLVAGMHMLRERFRKRRE